MYYFVLNAIGKLEAYLTLECKKGHLTQIMKEKFIVRSQYVRSRAIR